jgi:hypothetical protein
VKIGGGAGRDADCRFGRGAQSAARVRGASLLRLVLSCGLLACAHTHSAGDADPKAATASGGDAKSTTAGAGETGGGSSPTRRQSQLTSPAGGAGAGEGLPLATSPAGLLKPHAIEDIQDRLETKGALPPDQRSGQLDGPTREALRKFQKDAGLPATGAPDEPIAMSN